MSPLLLIDPHQAAPIHTRRTRTRERIRARLAPWRLDVALARGAPPDMRGDLSLRAQQLINLRTRTRLAAEIRQVVRDATRPRHPFERQLHPCAPEVLDVAPLLYDLADQLAHPGPVEARGVAQVRLLLRDGTGPLYDEPWPGYLACCLTHALSALAPTPTDCWRPGRSTGASGWGAATP